MESLLLDQTLWDLVGDANGNIAACDEPYAIAQDVACAVRLFSGELWYDTAEGIPYFSEILGERPPLALYKSLVEKAALNVAGVAAAQCLFDSFANRRLTGQIQIIDTAGRAANVQF